MRPGSDSAPLRRGVRHADVLHLQRVEARIMRYNNITGAGGPLPDEGTSMFGIWLVLTTMGTAFLGLPLLLSFDRMR